MEVHRELSPGFLEAAYQEAFEFELRTRGIPFCREVSLEVVYKGKPLNCSYKADFVCFGNIIVELKAIKQLSLIERAQTINYLKATGFERAMLFKFGGQSLEYERLINQLKSA